MSKKKKNKTKVKKQAAPKTSASSKAKKGFELNVNAKYVAWAALALTFLLTIIIRSNFLDISFERDEGTYSYMGQLVLDGKLPYQDYYSMKLPGIYYAYASFWRIGWRSVGSGFCFIIAYSGFIWLYLPV